jgi:hypothetical protein
MLQDGVCMRGIFQASVPARDDEAAWLLSDVRLPTQAVPNWWFSGSSLFFEPTPGTLLKMQDPQKGLATVVEGVMPDRLEASFRINGRPIRGQLVTTGRQVMIESAEIDTQKAWDTILLILEGKGQDSVRALAGEAAAQQLLCQDDRVFSVKEIASCIIPTVLNNTLHARLALDRLSRRHEMGLMWTADDRWMPIRHAVMTIEPVQVVSPITVTADEGICPVCQYPAMDRWTLCRFSGKLTIDTIVVPLCCGIRLHTSCLTETPSCPQCRCEGQLFTHRRRQAEGRHEIVHLDIDDLHMAQ